MSARKSTAELLRVVARPGGLEAVYERHPDGTHTRTVREAASDHPYTAAAKRTADESAERIATKAAKAQPDTAEDD